MAEESVELQQAALAWIDQHGDQIVDFCGEFIRFPSVLTDEREVQDAFVEPFLRAGNFDEIERVSDDPEKDRPNLVAVWKGTGGGRSVYFNGHCDVVPVYPHERERWTTDPFDPVEKDGKLFGRGATDMKAGITGYLWAARALQEIGARLAGDLFVSVVVGEESGHPHFGCLPTMRRHIARHGKPDFTIVAEGTHTEIHIISGGFLGFEVDLVGKEVHVSARNLVAYPQRYGIPQGPEVGVDSIVHLRELLDRLEQLERRWVMNYRHQILGGGGYPVPTDRQGVAPFWVHVGRIEAGDWAGSVAGHAHVEGGILYPSWVDEAEARQQLQAEIDALVSCDPWLREHPPVVKVGEKYNVPPFATSVDHDGCKALARSFERASGRTAVFSGFKGVHDGCYMQREFGVDVATLGPGDLMFGAHGPDEYVPVNQLIECAKAYACFAIEWCGVSNSDSVAVKEGKPSNG